MNQLHVLQPNTHSFRRLFSKIPLLLLFLAACSLRTSLRAQTPQLTEAIRLNQVGFYPQASKIAVVVGAPAGPFYLTKPGQSERIFKGQLGASRTVEFSKKTTRIADFSAFKSTGTYVLVVPGMGRSYPFEISPQVFLPVAKAALKGFYYIRASTALPETYAGTWHRPAGHPDTQVLVHASAANAQRPAGTSISSPGGWYDAGDYNKYIVNSGISVGTILSAYEDFPAYFKTQDLNIPESRNALPDVLDEALWNIRWMLTMQDPHDGGVYHKLTNPKFDGMVMPGMATTPRYVVAKSTAATLDFAAVMAQASRILGQFPGEVPGLSDSCLAAATKAWDWAVANPAVLYQQNEMNKQFDPDVVTGEYGDGDVKDEFIWAAAELYITTKKESYYTAVKLFPDDAMPLPSWAQVRLLGYYSLARFEKVLTPIAKKEVTALKKRLVDVANALTRGVSEQPYQTVMGKSAKDYIWGSSAVAANQGIALIQAYQLTRDKKYLSYALGNLDYLLGRNATGYSFLTGYGDKTPMHPHHRPSEADGITEPVPGLLSGGTNANAARQDPCKTYSSTSADEVYVDEVCSYASNEIAINWNAPLVYLAAALEAMQTQITLSTENK